MMLEVMNERNEALKQAAEIMRDMKEITNQMLPML